MTTSDLSLRMKGRKPIVNIFTTSQSPVASWKLLPAKF